MNFRDYWLAIPPGDARTAFATRCRSTVGYFNLIASGHKKAGESLALNIERESGGAVTVETLRPDVDWGVIRGKPAKPTSADHRAA